MLSHPSLPIFSPFSSCLLQSSRNHTIQTFLTGNLYQNTNLTTHPPNQTKPNHALLLPHHPPLHPNPHVPHPLHTSVQPRPQRPRETRIRARCTMQRKTAGMLARSSMHRTRQPSQMSMQSAEMLQLQRQTTQWIAGLSIEIQSRRVGLYRRHEVWLWRRVGAGCLWEGKGECDVCYEAGCGC